MDKLIVGYSVGAYVYCAARSAFYAPKLEKNEYMTDRVGRHLFLMGIAPVAAPVWLYFDAKNLEHVVRKMPGPIDKWPW